MRKILLSSASFALILTACQGTSVDIPKSNLIEGVSHVETVKQKGNDVIIPYKKYTLDNGLTVVLHQDKSDPLVHVDVTYQCYG